MNRRVVSWLAVITAAVLLAAIWLDRAAKSKPAADTSSAYLQGLEAKLNDVVRVRIARGDGSAVTLVRSSGNWQVLERRYAADAVKLRKLLLDLAALRAVEEKTADPARYAVLGVEPTDKATATGSMIELWTDGSDNAKPAIAVIIGKAAGTRETYARRRDDKTSYLLRPAVTVDAAPARWLDTAVLDLKSERIQKIQATVEASPPWQAARAKAGDTAWSLNSTPAKPAAAVDANVITGLLASFAGLACDDLRDAGHAAEAPKDRLQLTTFDGLTVELGGVRDGDKRWLRVAATAAAAGTQAEAATLQNRGLNREFEIPSWKYDGIFRKLSELAPAKPPS